MGSIPESDGSIPAPESLHSQHPPDMSRKLQADEEILTKLKVFQPVTSSEKNVWAFWHSGLSNSPPWNQRNVVSWVRRLGPSWTVRVLDPVEGSPVHVSKYIDPSLFPEAFIDKKMGGLHLGQHMADLVRLPLLYLYGGVWLDVGTLLFQNLDDLCWNELSDPATPFEMAGFKVTFTPEMGFMYNGFIAARKGNICIKYWYETVLEVWKGVTTTEGMHKHPLLRHLPKYEPPSAKGQPPFKYAQFVDYIVHIFCLERLRHVKDPGVGWDGPRYFANNVLLFDCVQEVYWAQRMTMWDGRKQFDLLATKRDTEAKDGNWKEADTFVESILANSAMMKVSHGLATAGREYLAEIWDKPENHRADVEPGSFAEYLRWASEYSERPREIPRVAMPVIEEAVLVGGVTSVTGERPAEFEAVP